MKTYLTIGGLVAAGFNNNGEFLLTVSHSGRGVYSTQTWVRVARDYTVIYPENGKIAGIGPLNGETIEVKEMDFELGVIRLTSTDERFILNCESNGIEVLEREA